MEVLKFNMARKSLLTPTRIEMIIEGIKSRLPLELVARSSKITYQTLRNWLNSGEELKQQLEDGKIERGDLTTKQRREIELYEKVFLVKTQKERGYLDKIHDIAEKKEDIRAYQWLLKISDPVFRNVDREVVEANTVQNSNDVAVVVSIGPGGVETTRLLSEFTDGSVKDAEEKEEHSEDSKGGGK